MISFYVGIVNV